MSRHGVRRHGKGGSAAATPPPPPTYNAPPPFPGPPLLPAAGPSAQAWSAAPAPAPTQAPVSPPPAPVLFSPGAVAAAQLQAAPEAPLLPPAPRPPAYQPSAPALGGHGAVSTLAPASAPVVNLPLATVSPPIVPRPSVSLVPGGRGQRKAAKRERRRRQLRRGSVVGAAITAVVAVVAGVLVTAGTTGRKQVVTDASTGRTQHTLLLSLAPSGGSSVLSALIAHDSASGHGAVVLVPSDIVTEVAGHGSMQLGAASTFGADTQGETLSDMIGVTIDADWALTPDALGALVDHLGGITVDVPVDISANNQVVVTAGNGQHLTGAQAAAMATYLGPQEPSGARLARFETVLVAVMSKLGTQPAAVATAIATLGGGSVTAGGEQLVDQVMAGIDADSAAQNVTYTNLPTDVLDTGDSQEELSVDGTEVTGMVKQYFAASVPRGRVVGRNRVIVLNGTGQLGLGQSARERLIAHGLVFVRSANQPGFAYKTKPSVVLVPDATPDSLASGRRVAAALRLPASDVETATVDTSAADVLTILGDDYKP